MMSHMGLLVNRSTKLPIHTLLFFLGVRGLGDAGVDSNMTCSGSGSCMASVCTSASLTSTALGGLNLSHQQAESHLASPNSYVMYVYLILPVFIWEKSNSCQYLLLHV